MNNSLHAPRVAWANSFARDFAAQRRPAFTLVEVLATLVLIGIIIPVAMRGISVAMSTATTARRTSEAASLAQAKLNELVATGEWQFGAASGDFGANWLDYRWTMETASRDVYATEIAIKVTWQQRGVERSLSVTTMAATLEDTGDFAAGGLP